MSFENVNRRAYEIAQKRLRDRPAPFGGDNAPLPSRFDVDQARPEAIRQIEALSNLTDGVKIGPRVQAAAISFECLNNISSEHSLKLLTLLAEMLNSGIPYEEIVRRLERPSNS